MFLLEALEPFGHGRGVQELLGDGKASEALQIAKEVVRPVAGLAPHPVVELMHALVEALLGKSMLVRVHFASRLLRESEVGPASGVPPVDLVST